MATIINADTSNGLKLTSDTSGQLELQSAGSTKVTMDTSGKVGIGGTPSEPLSVFRTGGQSEGINIRNTSSGNGSRLTFETTRSDDSSVQEMAAVQVYAIAGYDSAANSDSVMTFETQNSGTTAEQMRLDEAGNLKFNSGYGSVATAYGCRAWVNFNGTGTVAIRASGNVSSITDNGTGDYTVNFTNAMPDADYVFVMSQGGGNNYIARTREDATARTTSAVRFITLSASFGAADPIQVNVAIVR